MTSRSVSATNFRDCLIVPLDPENEILKTDIRITDGKGFDCSRYMEGDESGIVGGISALSKQMPHHLHLGHANLCMRSSCHPQKLCRRNSHRSLESPGLSVIQGSDGNF